jgi:hypothetical protein
VCTAGDLLYRLRVSARLADGWYAPTRDNYLAAFAQFWAWVADRHLPVPTTLEFSPHVLL